MELYHHGIKGQKWGVENGPPYPLDAKTQKRVMKKARKDAEKKQRELAKNRAALSDEELKAQIERVNLEIRLRDLTETNLNPGRTTAKKMLINAGQTAINTLSKESVSNGIKEVIDIAKAVK